MLDVSYALGEANIFSATIKENNINILEVDEHIEIIAASLKVEINKTLEEYGLHIPEFYVSSILTPDDDPNFRRMKEQYAEQYLLVRDEQIKKNIAYLSGNTKLYKDITLVELLRMCGEYYGLKDLGTYTDSSYELDRELILNERFNEHIIISF